MAVTYDKYYLTEDLFGEPYSELIEFFTEFQSRGKVLDLGCGQGRDAIPLARLGYAVTGVDNSKVGIAQMNQVAQDENLDLVGQVGDIYEFARFDNFDIVLLDSMFHFTKKDREKETGLIKRILNHVKKGCLIVFCIQDTGEKVEILNRTIDFQQRYNLLLEKKFNYTFEDKESGHKSETKYKMIVVE